MSSSNKNYKNTLKAIFIFLSLSMIGIIILTSLKSNLFTLNITEPWFYTTLIDFYFNIVVISAWVVYKEKYLISAFIWILSFILLGSVSTCFYVFLKLSKASSISEALLKDV